MGSSFQVVHGTRHQIKNNGFVNQSNKPHTNRITERKKSEIERVLANIKHDMNR